MLTSENFDGKTGSGVHVVDFSATWCGPCKALKPSVEKLEKEYENRVGIHTVDIDGAKPLVERFSIKSVPTIIFLKDGGEVGRHVGFISYEALKDKIEDAIRK